MREVLRQEKKYLMTLLDGQRLCARLSGFLLEDDPLWGLYLEEHVLRLRKAAAGLERARSPAAREKRERLLAAAEALAERKGAWELAHRT